MTAGVRSHRSMPPVPDLAEISSRTLGHYDGRARDFWEGTRDHDVSQNIAALLDAVEGAPPLAILASAADRAGTCAGLRSLAMPRSAWTARNA